MILSEQYIRALSIKDSSPLISPFVEEQLQGATYDVSLSGTIATMKRLGGPIDPADKKAVGGMYQVVLLGPDGYTLSPGEYILAELRESVCLPDNLAARICPRTRFTRGGIIVANQYCNPTYSGKLQIGIFNAGVNGFVIRPGIRIAQLIFEELTSAPGEDKLYRNKPDAAYSEENEFRGAVYGESGWTDSMKSTYASMLRELSRGK